MHVEVTLHPPSSTPTSPVGGGPSIQQYSFQIYMHVGVTLHRHRQRRHPGTARNHHLTVTSGGTGEPSMHTLGSNQSEVAVEVALEVEVAMELANGYKNPVMGTKQSRGAPVGWWGAGSAHSYSNIHTFSIYKFSLPQPQPRPAHPSCTISGNAACQRRRSGKTLDSRENIVQSPVQGITSTLLRTLLYLYPVMAAPNPPPSNVPGASIALSDPFLPLKHSPSPAITPYLPCRVILELSARASPSPSSSAPPSLTHSHTSPSLSLPNKDTPDYTLHTPHSKLESIPYLPPGILPGKQLGMNICGFIGALYQPDRPPLALAHLRKCKGKLEVGYVWCVWHHHAGSNSCMHPRPPVDDIVAGPYITPWIIFINYFLFH